MAKKNLGKTFFILLQVLMVTNCYLVQMRPSVNSDHPGKCWFEDAKQAVNPGEDYMYLKTCERYSCLGDYSFEIAGCGKVSAEPPCYVTETDYNKPYPDCCPTGKCPPN